jgi:hypothetical protein
MTSDEVKVLAIGLPGLIILSGCLIFVVIDKPSATTSVKISSGKKYEKELVKFEECKLFEQPIHSMVIGPAKDKLQSEVHQCYIDAAKNDTRMRGVATSYSSYPATPASSGRCRLSRASYGRLSDGISYSEAVGILGCDGVESARSSVGSFSTVIYSWTNAGTFGTISATFQNDGLVNRAQAGLQ